MTIRIDNLTPKEKYKISEWKSDRAISKMIMSQFKKTNIVQAEKWIIKNSNDTNQKLFGIYLNSNKEKLIGISRLMFIDFESLVAELGIYIGEKKLQNMGYGSIALKKTLEFGFNILKLNKIYLKVLASNQRAINLYSKNNFEIEGCLKDHFLCKKNFEDVIYMSIFKKDFKK